MVQTSLCVSLSALDVTVSASDLNIFIYRDVNHLAMRYIVWAKNVIFRVMGLIV
jgi:hypothetical protein